MEAVLSSHTFSECAAFPVPRCVHQPRNSFNLISSEFLIQLVFFFSCGYDWLNCGHRWLKSIPRPSHLLKGQKVRSGIYSCNHVVVSSGNQSPSWSSLEPTKNQLISINSGVTKKGLLWIIRYSYHCLQCGRPGFDPWVRKILWRRKWQPTPVFLPGKSHGQRSLVGYSPWGHNESDTTEQLHFHH